MKLPVAAPPRRESFRSQMSFAGSSRSELRAVNMRLAAKQNMEYKFVELMSLQYTRSPEDIVQHQITYRYNAMKVGFLSITQ